MRIFNELRYPSSNLSEIFTQRMFQASFEKIWKIFFELSRGQAWSYGRTDRQTDGQTDRQTDRRTDAGNDNTPPALGPRGKNDSPGYMFASTFTKFCALWEGLPLPQGTNFVNVVAKLSTALLFLIDHSPKDKVGLIW